MHKIYPTIYTTIITNLVETTTDTGRCAQLIEIMCSRKFAMGSTMIANTLTYMLACTTKHVPRILPNREATGLVGAGGTLPKKHAG